jgi:hypothetical protein
VGRKIRGDLMATLQQTLREVVDVILHSAEIRVEEIRHHQDPVAAIAVLPTLPHRSYHRSRRIRVQNSSYLTTTMSSQLPSQIQKLQRPHKNWYSPSTHTVLLSYPSASQMKASQLHRDLHCYDGRSLIAILHKNSRMAVASK